MKKNQATTSKTQCLALFFDGAAALGSNMSSVIQILKKAPGENVWGAKVGHTVPNADSFQYQMEQKCDIQRSVDKGRDIYNNLSEEQKEILSVIFCSNPWAPFTKRWKWNKSHAFSKFVSMTYRGTTVNLLPAICYTQNIEPNDLEEMKQKDLKKLIDKTTIWAKEQLDKILTPKPYSRENVYYLPL